MKMAGLPPPTELLTEPTRNDGRTLGYVLRLYANSGIPAPTQQITIGSLMREVGSVRLVDADYQWVSGYVRRLKVENNLAPNSIRHRVQALGRAIDEFLRTNPDVKLQNAVRLLPKGYSSYTDVDRKLVEAAGKEVRRDVSRDRRLHPGEEERIVRALSGEVFPGKPRALLLEGGNALLTLFRLIVSTGLRLREAYSLRRGQVDLDAKVIRAQCSKQWRGRVAFRDVPIRPELYAVLREYLSTRAMLPAAYLFPFLEEEPDMTLKKCTQRLSDRFRVAFEYAGCENLHEHDLRHEATCRWLEMRDASGGWMWRLEEINRIMGWAPNSTMAHRYASFRGADLAQRMWVNVKDG